MTRTELMQDWLQQQFPDGGWRIEPASADASFRRYFRVTANGASHIVMDAPPQHEDCAPFLHVAQIFARAGVHVPEIIAQNQQQGFLLLSDLGHTTYLEAIDDSNADNLYMDAIDALIKIQCASSPGILPAYDDALLRRELQLFPEWYAGKHARIELSSSQRDVLERSFSLIVLNNLAQPQVYVHRDYHSRNLMQSAPNPGVLDFQDAVYGPITYDLASLLKDAYIRWDEEHVLDWCIRYWERARKAGLPVNTDFHDFYRDFEWMGVQRHIKVLGIFARLCHRDGKDGYLKDMPLVMTYLRKACERYSGLGPLLRLLDELENRQAAVGYSF
ncbi:MAG: phosphotransferase [Sulfuricella sp.]|jgi:hypothetical protein